MRQGRGLRGKRTKILSMLKGGGGPQKADKAHATSGSELAPRISLFFGADYLVVGLEQRWRQSRLCLWTAEQTSCGLPFQINLYTQMAS